MSDIVKRLRDPSSGSPCWLDTMQEAAARLRAEVEALRARVAEQDEHCLRLGEEISHLHDGALGLGERGA